MSFWHFVFSFLFVRNWHTGQKELSRPRVALFFGGLALVMLALVLIAFLQSKTVYLP
jgi:hypothetical protein